MNNNDILFLEGLSYLDYHLKRFGVHIYNDLYSFVTDKSWEDLKKELRKIQMSDIIDDFKLLKKTKTKKGLNNYVFTLKY